ncbi:MAG: hypothetical protein WCO06_07415 [Candidatus Roizmanbacteria bacterium]
MGDKKILSHQSQPNKHDYYSILRGTNEEGGISSFSWKLWKTFQPLHKINWKILRILAVVKINAFRKCIIYS